MTEKQRKPRRDRVERYPKTVIPKGYKPLVLYLERLGEVEHKITVSVFSDENGPFVSIMKLGSTNENVSLFLNKSRGWVPSKNADGLQITKWHTGDLRINVPNDKALMKRAAILCQEWKWAKRAHIPKRTVTGKKKTK